MKFDNPINMRFNSIYFFSLEMVSKYIKSMHLFLET